MPVPAAECDDRDVIAARQGRRLEQLLAANLGRNAFYTKKLGASAARLAVSGRSRQAARHDEDRARRRSGSARAVGKRAQRAARAVHAVHADILHHEQPAAMARHQRELAVDARLLEGRVPCGARRGGRSDLLRVLLRAVPRFLDRVRRRLSDRRARHSRRGHVEPAASRDDRRRLADGRLLHADLRASPGGGRHRQRPAAGPSRRAASARSSSRASRAAAFRPRATGSNERAAHASSTSTGSPRSAPPALNALNAGRCT